MHMQKMLIKKYSTPLHPYYGDGVGNLHLTFKYILL